MSKYNAIKSVANFGKGKKEMTIQRIMTILSYGGKPVKPANVSDVRWNAMVKMAKRELFNQVYGV